MKDPVLGPVFACMYPGLCDVARRLGYALAVHGTLTHDLDLIAVPWTDEAVDAVELKDALLQHIGSCGYAELLWRDCPWLTTEDVRQVVANQCDGDDGRQNKPWGRIAWNLYLWAGAKVDLSILPKNARA